MSAVPRIDRIARFVEHAELYSKLGWALIRCEGKRPRDDDWQRTQPGELGSAVGKWRYWGEKWNMGVVCGTSGLAVVDVDRDDADDAARELLGELPVTPAVRTGSGRLQVYFRDPGGLEKKARDGFELRVGPHQCLLPPSEHPDTGREYAWLEGREPWACELAELPPSVIEFFAAGSAGNGRVAAPVADVIPQGRRDDTLISIAGWLRHKGLGETEIVAALREVNRLRCQPPLAEADVERIARSAARYPAGSLPSSRHGSRNGAPQAGAATGTLTEHPTVWTPTSLSKLAARPPQPAERMHGLVYDDATTLVSSEPGVGKSMLLAAAVAEEAIAGRVALFLDFEDVPGTLAERLDAAGLTDEQKARVLYLRPEEPTTPEQIRAMVHAAAPKLVVLDSYDAALAAFGFETKNEDIRAFHALVNVALRSQGAPLLIADHVAKDRERRGRYSIGGQAKLALADVHLGLSPIVALRRGSGGKLKVKTHKDRRGWLPRAARFELTADPETGALSWHVAAEEGDADPDGFRPTGLMEKVSRYLEVSGQARSRNQVESDVKGKSDYVRRAMDVLVEEGYADEDPGPNRARLLTLVRPFREDDDE